jgi:hypothetical protein
MGLKLLKPLAAAAILAVCTAGSAWAHHSFQATYDLEHKITIEGTLVAFQFRNPHSFVQVLVEDESGEMQRWGVEWGGASALTRQGVTRTTLKPGDHVVISGAVGRDRGDHRMRMETLLRPDDGFGWGQNGEKFD